MKSEPGPPMTLGNAAAARVRLIVWCQDCQHKVEPDPAEMAARYGADITATHWLLTNPRRRAETARTDQRAIGPTSFTDGRGENL
jgi:hypothetical protein